MALPSTSGLLDPGTNSYIAPNTGTWANLSIWSGWSNWANKPATYMTVSSDIQDRGSVDYFNLITDTTAIGNVSYSVWTSNTGSFAGEETISNISPYTANLSSFYGRYFIVQANVVGANPQLQNMTITSTNSTIDLSINDLVVSNTTIAADGFEIPMPRTVSRILNIQITTQDRGNTYPLTTDTEHYYMETPIYRGVVPYVTSKDRTVPKFVTRDINYGTLTRAPFTADFRILALPEQIHDGLNLRTK